MTKLKSIFTNRYNVKSKICLFLLGAIWPFIVGVVSTFINVHIVYMSDWFFMYVILPVMALGIMPIFVGFASVLPKILPLLRWTLSIIFTGLITVGLSVLILLFLFLFHFAIGGSC